MTAAVSQLFAALSDDNRRALLEAVAARPGITATELTADFPITRQAIAKHLGLLAEAGLLTAERAGRETQYRVVPGSLRPATVWLASAESAWSSRLGRLHQRLDRRDH